MPQSCSTRREMQIKNQVYCFSRPPDAPCHRFDKLIQDRILLRRPSQEELICYHHKNTVTVSMHESRSDTWKVALWTLSQIISVNNGVDIVANTDILKIELTNWGNFDGHYHYIISFPVPLRTINIVQSLKPSSVLCNYLLFLNSCPSGGKKITKSLREFGSVQENECKRWLEPLLTTCHCLPPLCFTISFPPWR